MGCTSKKTQGGRDRPGSAFPMSSARWSRVVPTAAGVTTAHPYDCSTWWPLLLLLRPREKKKFPVAVTSLFVPFTLTTPPGFSPNYSRPCLLFPAGSLTSRSRTWDEKHEVPVTQGEVPPDTGFLALVRCPGPVSGFERDIGVEF